MGWVALAKKLVKDGLDKTWQDQLVDNLAYLYGRTTLMDGILNRSFEIDSDVDGDPDTWTVTAYAGGSYTLDTATPLDGAIALKMTASSGGGYVEAINDTFIPCATGQRIRLEWEMKASVATVRIRAQVLWYDKDEGYLSTTDYFDESSGNPTSAARRQVNKLVPASARFYKVKFTAGESGGSVDGNVWIDGIEAGVYHGFVPVTIEDANNPIDSQSAVNTYTVALPAAVIGSEQPIFARVLFEESAGSGGAVEWLAGISPSFGTVYVFDSSGGVAIPGQTFIPYDVPLDHLAQFRWKIVTGGSTWDWHLLGYVV